MSELNYQWKIKGFNKGVDPNEAATELKRLQDLYGELNPKVIVKEAEKKKSPLHNIFEWDAEKAAYNWRLQQARVLLNNIVVVTITDGEERKIDAFEITSTPGERYKRIDTFTPDDIDYVRATTLHSLKIIRDKLKTYENFDKATYHIDQAIEIMA